MLHEDKNIINVMFENKVFEAKSTWTLNNCIMGNHTCKLKQN